MGLFSRKPKSPELPSCPCGEEFEAGSSLAHWQAHLVEVTANAGHPAYAFDCPRCGRSDLAWGLPDDDPDRRRLRAASAMAIHMEQRHGVRMLS